MTIDLESLEDFVKDFYRYEIEWGAYDLSLFGRQVYPYLRIPLYYMITEEMGFNSQQVNNLLVSKSRRFKVFLSLCRGLLQAIFKSRGTCDVLMIEHPKKTFRDGKWVDQYSYQLNKTLMESRRVRVLVHPNSTNPDLKNIYGKNIAIDYSPYLFGRKVIELFLRRNKQVLAVSSQIYDQISSRYPVGQSIKGKILDLVAKAIAEEIVAKFVLNKYKPSVLGSVVSYGHAAAFHSVAKDIGVPSFEVQHGAITHNHMGYSYPVTQVNIFPDYLLVFGEYWSENAAFPLSKEKICSAGFVGFDEKRKESPTRNGKYILFVSQNVNVFDMAQYALAVAEALPEEKVVFRLHPKLAGDSSINQKLFGSNMPPNLDVSSSPKRSIYDLFVEAKVQVGVFSTAIYEGIGVGVPTVILKLSGWEVMARMSDYMSVSFASSNEELVEACLNLAVSVDTSVNDSGKLFAYNALENSRTIAESIICNGHKI